MVKYIATEITFREVPDKVTRTFSISNCGGLCEGCHSPFLRGDYGEELTPSLLIGYMEHDKEYVDCYVFLGEGNDLPGLQKLMQLCKEYGYEVCLYTGKEIFNMEPDFIGLIDYLKVGPYIQSLGGLESEKTNQKFYHINYLDEGYSILDITNNFLTSNSQVIGDK